MSPDVAVSLCTKYGGEDCLQLVDRDIMQQLMDKVGGEDVICFVSVDYAYRVQEVFVLLRVTKLSFNNIWQVFTKMIPHLSEST